MKTKQKQKIKPKTFKQLVESCDDCTDVQMLRDTIKEMLENITMYEKYSVESENDEITAIFISLARSTRTQVKELEKVMNKFEKILDQVVNYQEYQYNTDGEQSIFYNNFPSVDDN